MCPGASKSAYSSTMMAERTKTRTVRVVGKNVQEFINRENELKERREAVAYTKSKEIYSVWEKTAVRNQAAKARQTLNENRFEEIKQLEVEVKVRRNARLKDLYRTRAEEYDRRLREKGLAYVKDVV